MVDKNRFTNEHANSRGNRERGAQTTEDPSAVEEDDEGIEKRATPSPGDPSFIEETGGVLRERVVRTPEGTTFTEEAQSTLAVPSPLERQQARAYRIRRIVYFVTHTIAIFTFIRFVLLLLGANPENVFTQFIVLITTPFVAPFIGLFGLPVPFDGTSQFDPSLLFAIAIYYLFAWIIARIATFAVTRPVGEGPKQEVEPVE